MTHTILSSSTTMIRTGEINEYGVFDGVIVQGTGFTFDAEGRPVSGQVFRVDVQGALIPELGSFRLTNLPVEAVEDLNAHIPGWYSPEAVADIFLRLTGVELTLTDALDAFFSLDPNNEDDLLERTMTGPRSDSDLAPLYCGQSSAALLDDFAMLQDFLTLEQADLGSHAEYAFHLQDALQTEGNVIWTNRVKSCAPGLPAISLAGLDLDRIGSDAFQASR